MAKGRQDTSELALAAEALEKELAALETLSRSVQKIRLNSQKNIVRASRELSDVAALPERLAQGLQAFAGAMARMQSRQQTALEPLAAFATELQARREKLDQHLLAFAALGVAAAEITALLKDGPPQSAEPAPLGASVTERLDAILENARALFDAANADDFPDISREADSLRQRVAALKKRLDSQH